MSNPIWDGLKWIGKNVLSGKMVTAFLPVLRGLAGATATTLDDRALDIYEGLGNTVKMMEATIPAAMKEATGPDKAKAAMVVVVPMIRLVETAKGNEIADEAEFLGACLDYINATVRLQKSLKTKN